MATEGKKVRIKVQTIHAVYIGDILLPAMRNRVSDFLNDDKFNFMTMTDVQIENTKTEMDFICINKAQIESISLAQ